MLEMIIMLRFNKDLWDEEIIQQCMVRLNRTTTTSTATPSEVTQTPVSIAIATTTSSGSKRTNDEIYDDEVDVSSSNTEDDD